ncbi:hypothetical protein CSA56_18545 [candidate division KSB3 bacterium]|uniref:Uncharacterized protein n=1 Tax=candidate division KSB3 bacterium TaxID=2044937 RepID=A0A2G6K6M1_9BACT|nr:MAG: hypothetical protein CSA56_18545 [candidate division KSB3 bacterium]
MMTEQLCSTFRGKGDVSTNIGPMIRHLFQDIPVRYGCIKIMTLSRKSILHSFSVKLHNDLFIIKNVLATLRM